MQWRGFAVQQLSLHYSNTPLLSSNTCWAGSGRGSKTLPGSINGPGRAGGHYITKMAVRAGAAAPMTSPEWLALANTTTNPRSFATQRHGSSSSLKVLLLSTIIFYALNMFLGSHMGDHPWGTILLQLIGDCAYDTVK